MNEPVKELAKASRKQNESGSYYINYGEKILDLLGVHDLCKFISNPHYAFKRAGASEELMKEVNDLERTAQKQISEVMKDIYELCNDKKREAMIDSNIIKHNPKTLGIFMGLHELEKMSYELEGAASRSGNEKLADLAKRLSQAFDDIYTTCIKVKGREESQEKILKKYGKNVFACLAKNTNIIIPQHNIKDKDLVGNKGSQLVEMFNAGIRIPETFILSTQLCEKWHTEQDISDEELKFVRRLFYGFDSDMIAVRSSGTVSMAGAMKTVLNVNKTNPEELKKAFLEVINSWDSPQVKRYRELSGLSLQFGVAIVVQPMIDATKGLSGIGFTQDVLTGDNVINGEFLLNEFGEDLASGSKTPKSFYGSKDSLPQNVYDTLLGYKAILHKIFETVVDFEFVYDGTETYLVQARKAKLSDKANIVAHYNLFEQKIISRADVGKYVNERTVGKFHSYTAPKGAQLLAKGRPVSSGIVHGLVVADFKDLDGENYILAKNTISVEEFILLDSKKFGGLILKEGGYTSHPSVVCREFKKPCILGVDLRGLVSSHSIVTINGETGEVYKGLVEFSKGNTLSHYLTKLNEQ